MEAKQLTKKDGAVKKTEIKKTNPPKKLIFTSDNIDQIYDCSKIMDNNLDVEYNHEKKLLTKAYSIAMLTAGDDGRLGRLGNGSFPSLSSVVFIIIIV